MPVRRTISATEGVYFITFTCTNWISLFSLCNAYDVVYKWFDYLKEQKHYIIGYVIMPNHVHAVIAFSNQGKSINMMVSNGKRFIAYELVERLKLQNKVLVLDELSRAMNNTEKGEGKLHKVFETSFDWKECRTMKFIEQKLDYMHWNPCKGAKLASKPEDYPHSSAKFYILGVQGVHPVTSCMELNDIDLRGTL